MTIIVRQGRIWGVQCNRCDTQQEWPGMAPEPLPPGWSWVTTIVTDSGLQTLAASTRICSACTKDDTKIRKVVG